MSVSATPATMRQGVTEQVEKMHALDLDLYLAWLERVDECSCSPSEEIPTPVHALADGVLRDCGRLGYGSVVVHGVDCDCSRSCCCSFLRWRKLCRVEVGGPV